MRAFKISLINLLLGFFLISTSGHADTFAHVIKVENMTRYSQGQALPAGSELITANRQRLAVKTVEGDIVVLKPNSRIVLKEANLFQQLFGKIFYFFKQRKDHRASVQTATATIGIRGTRFVVSNQQPDMPDQVSLDEGLLNIDSPDNQPFRVLNTDMLSEFQRFKLEMEQGVEAMNKEFEDYKREINQEFIEYKMSVMLEAGKTLKISGKDLYTVDLPDDQRLEIDSFKEFLSDIDGLNEY